MSKHIAIIGRVPGDDEDSCYIYSDMDEVTATDRFESDLYAWADEGTKESVVARYGQAVYLSQILVSDSPITQTL